jgi:hypothetical protein
MNSNPTEPILAARNAFTNTRNERQCLEELHASNAAFLRERILNADITTAEGLGEIARLKTLDDVLPIRIAARHLDEGQKERELIDAVNTFIGSTLSPRARKSQNLASAKVRDELKPHYSNPTLLEMQVARSEKVNRFTAILPSISQSPQEGALNFGQRALDAWEKLADLEAKS